MARLYEDGSIKYIGTFKDGVEQGLWKFYYNTGELKAKGILS